MVKTNAIHLIILQHSNKSSEIKITRYKFHQVKCVVKILNFYCLYMIDFSRQIKILLLNMLKLFKIPDFSA